MLFTWPARVVAHVGSLAVVQVPGGLLTARDPHGFLVDDVETEVRGVDPTHAQAGVVFLDLITRVERAGEVALLISDAGQVTPLLVPPLQELPASFALSIPVLARPAVDPDEGGKPFATRVWVAAAGPEPTCCPDIDPDVVHAMVPPCCPDIDVSAIDALFAGAAAAASGAGGLPAPADDPFAFITTQVPLTAAAAGPFIAPTTMEELLAPVTSADPLAFPL